MDNPKVCFLVINLANAHCIVRKRQISFHSLPFQDKLLFFVMTFLKLSSFCLQCNSQGSYFIQLWIPFSVLGTILFDFKTNDFTSLIFFFWSKFDSIYWVNMGTSGSNLLLCHLLYIPKPLHCCLVVHTCHLMAPQHTLWLTNSWVKYIPHTCLDPGSSASKESETPFQSKGSINNNYIIILNPTLDWSASKGK